MDRKICLMIAVAAFAGCQPQVPLENPFMPQTTVPPPGTAGGAAPLYTAPPQVQVTPGATITAPAVTLPAMPSATLPPATLPATAPPTQQTPYYPPGGAFDFRQGSARKPSSAALADDRGLVPEDVPLEIEPAEPIAKRRSTARVAADAQAALNQPENALAADRFDRYRYQADDSSEESFSVELHEAVVQIPAEYAPAESSATELRIVEHAAGEEAAARNDHWSPSRARTAVAAINGDEETAPRAVAVSRSNGQSPASGQIALASYREPVRGKSVPGGSAYEHDKSYQRLRGKLEYSSVTSQWKLRYIPIDGETDSYGGSVVIANSGAFEGYRAGEFVTIEGSIVSEKSSGTRFAPKYEVNDVERQR